MTLPDDTPPARYDIMEEFGRLLASLYPSPPFLVPKLDDATLVLLATSMVDEFLKVVLVAGFRQSIVSKKRIDDVFTGHGALATFSAKISLCALLGMTTASARHDLTILRKIRNEFAHSHKELSLQAFPSCLSLQVASKFDIQDQSEERKKFKHSCLGIMGTLATSTLMRTAQARFLTKHADGVKLEYEAMMREHHDS
jgi:DNA-binding MltR family transcriptional regulator